MSKIPIPSSQQKKTGMAIINNGQGFKRPGLSDLRNDNGGFKPPSIKDMKEPDANEFKPPSVRNLREDDGPKFTPPSIQAMKSDFKPPSMKDLKGPAEIEFPDVPDNDYSDDDEGEPENLEESQHVQFILEQTKEEIPKPAEPSYTPYTVDDYKSMQKADEALNDLHSLGPSHDEEWEHKKEMRAKIMQFAKRTANENKATIPKKKVKEVVKKESKLDKMKKYAASVPKPKPASENHNQEQHSKPKKKAEPAVAKYDIEGALARHAHFQNRVNTLITQIANYLE
ncbi:hypothetical protein TVAG_156050 [Trichomonas vaginalis G3]|uniref:Uncharacterized protein n=1 Tax=Trichomonas vaginalis (strain ATCC PRA-98 / G3) TaxID=412133 RepID=A2FPC8_TRIV3|nr:hypothetical protein TVAGG3_0497910 [Trichomonas vaginalis G3]EAX93241.1 hypothetical protein TVAG_156050 [Trichomonas vaginalis G3]KAI5516857.1 hypothetical protein TVAGG3_0497910 [Trichomonas vaginalis G3]|eukprot:XP_001306171.1 hypothetical protein [Trichomonas vaginalis G3]